MRYRVAVDKGWAVLLLEGEPVPWSAQVVSEHDDAQEATAALDRLKAALAKAREDDGHGVRH